SAKLQTDIISQVPIIFIPDNSEKLAVRYSVLVRQYVLSKQAYDYLQILKKNTESIGNIFGVLPSEVSGNIHGLTDPNEQVIGFLTGSPVQQQRIFINATELPGWLYKQACSSIYVVNDHDSLKTFIDNYMVYDARVSGFVILGYYFSDPVCIDCRYRGGSLTKPLFW
ncbi:MAG TPA: DUF4249 family protein, partial [Flavisolibacter sp.]|nr:DUF4249 family protein [Flavisolibacter sp.]